jgi:hypothetical protein
VIGHAVKAVSVPSESANQRERVGNVLNVEIITDWREGPELFAGEGADRSVFGPGQQMGSHESRQHEMASDFTARY